MSRQVRYIGKTLSFRLSLMVIHALATLLMVALLVLLFFSRKAVKDEALRDAEQTLPAAVIRERKRKPCVMKNPAARLCTADFMGISRYC